MKTDTARRLTYRYLPEALETHIREAWRDMHAHRNTALSLLGDPYARLVANSCADRIEHTLRAYLAVRKTARQIGTGEVQ